MRLPRPFTQRRAAWCALALGVGCFVGGGVPLVAQATMTDGVRDVGAIPSARIDVTVRDVPQVRPLPPVAHLQPRRAPQRPPPVRLRLPRLHIDAGVVPVLVGRNGALGVPADPRRTGWWAAGARPGMPRGGVVIAGHVDSAALGLGAFFHLAEARPGDRVLVSSAAGRSTSYIVVARRSYPKSALPAKEIFAQDVQPRLVLITCGGRFDRATHNYQNNVVVYAVPR